jgi:AcrR family transcriptional regulator
MSRLPDPNAKVSLLCAAEAVFAEKGLAAAKVEDITRRAGLSKGAFYLHFESKEQAFEQVAESFLARCAAHFVRPSESANVPQTVAGLLAQWHERDLGIFEFLWQNRATLVILLGCRGEHEYLLSNFRDRAHAVAREWTQLYQERGLYRKELDADLAAYLVEGAYNELSYRMLTCARKPPLEEMLRAAREVFVRGLGTPRLIEALARSPRDEDSADAIQELHAAGNLALASGDRTLTRPLALPRPARETRRSGSGGQTKRRRRA